MFSSNNIFMSCSRNGFSCLGNAPVCFRVRPALQDGGPWKVGDVEMPRLRDTDFERPLARSSIAIGEVVLDILVSHNKHSSIRCSVSFASHTRFIVTEYTKDRVSQSDDVNSVGRFAERSPLWVRTRLW